MAPLYTGAVEDPGDGGSPMKGRSGSSAKSLRLKKVEKSAKSVNQGAKTLGPKKGCQWGAEAYV